MTIKGVAFFLVIGYIFWQIFGKMIMKGVEALRDKYD